jgi:Undecaprenyl-phosphate glucose phosphotransferase
MTLRLNSYRFYLRLSCYLLPLVAFTTAAYVRLVLLRRVLSQPDYDPRFYFVVLLVATLVWAIAAETYGLCDIEELFREYTGLKKVIPACAMTYVVLSCILFFYRQQNLSRVFFALSAAMLLAVTIFSRVLFRRVVRSRYGSHARVRVLIVGAEGYARKVAARLSRGSFVPTNVVGHIRLPGQECVVKDTPAFELEQVINGCGVAFDELIIAVPPSQFDRLSGLLGQLEPLHVPIRMVLDIGDRPIVRERLFQLGDLQMLDLATTHLESPTYFLLKRVFDVAFSSFVLTAGMPLFAIIALAIKLNSPGPVFFRQERVGLNGRLFTMYKFRTMRVASDNSSNELHTAVDDPRKTAVGALLRRTSLDELPQFFNVLIGDMSVVGPRPELTFFARKFAQEVLNYDTRHRLKVGITGWAQVNGWRGNTSIQKRIEADLYYLQNWTLWLDLRIVWMTVFKGLLSKHAY